MHNRNTFRLDEPTRLAAKKLALDLNITPPEALHRAVAHDRDDVLGVSAEDRRQRTAALDRLFVLFEGHDATEEIQHLKEQDQHG